MGKTDEERRAASKAYWDENKDEINRRRRERHRQKAKAYEKKLEDNKAYWDRNRDEINRRRRERYKVKQAELKAKEQAYMEHKERFLAEVQADSAAMEFMSSVLDGGNPRELIEAWAKHKDETIERG